jgi:hypothetical protein
MAAATAAREAADRCVADAALDRALPLADPAVPSAVWLADAAALGARESAASCDAAVGDSAPEADMSNMRGWLMMVATLFVGIGFQAVLQPPPTMSFHNSSPTAVSGAASPAPAPATTVDNATSLLSVWLTLNALTMFLSLSLLVMLMTMKRATSTGIILARGLLVVICCGVGYSLIIATTDNTTVRLVYVTGLGLVGAIGVSW